MGGELIVKIRYIGRYLSSFDGNLRTLLLPELSDIGKFSMLCNKAVPAETIDKINGATARLENLLVSTEVRYAKYMNLMEMQKERDLNNASKLKPLEMRQISGVLLVFACGLISACALVGFEWVFVRFRSLKRHQEADV